jgi:hypothetical protein
VNGSFRGRLRAHGEGIGVFRRDQAEPGGAERGAKVAAFGDIHRQVEHCRKGLQPVVRLRSAADRGNPGQRCARLGKRCQAVAEGKADAFEHGTRQRSAIGLVLETGKTAANGGIIVRCPLAGKIGQEHHRTGRLQRVAEF